MSERERETDRQRQRYKERETKTERDRERQRKRQRQKKHTYIHSHTTLYNECTTIKHFKRSPMFIETGTPQPLVFPILASSHSHCVSQIDVEPRLIKCTRKRHTLYTFS